MAKDIKQLQKAYQQVKERANGSSAPVYQPYKGPGGPTEQQIYNNNFVLQQELKKVGIYSQFTTLCKIPGFEDTELDDEVLSVKIGNSYIPVGYDRWGYVIDGVEDADQIDLSTTISKIKKLYQPVKERANGSFSPKSNSHNKAKYYPATQEEIDKEEAYIKSQTGFKTANGELNKWAIMIIAKLEYICLYGLSIVYKDPSGDPYKSFNSYLYDFWPDLPWNKEESNIVIDIILQDPKLPNIVKQIKDIWGWDMHKEFLDEKNDTHDI